MMMAMTVHVKRSVKNNQHLLQHFLSFNWTSQPQPTPNQVLTVKSHITERNNIDTRPLRKLALWKINLRDLYPL